MEFSIGIRSPMWSMDVYSKAWLLLWKAASNPSLREEGPSLRSGSRKWRPLRHGMGSISHRFTTPMDPWRTDFRARRNSREGEGMGEGPGRREDPPPAPSLPGTAHARSSSCTARNQSSSPMSSASFLASTYSVCTITFTPLINSHRARPADLGQLPITRWDEKAWGSCVGRKSCLQRVPVDRLY